MKKFNFKNYLVLLFIVSIGYSCSVEKRLHTGGYYVKFNKNKIKSDVKSEENSNQLALRIDNDKKVKSVEKRVENSNSISDQLNFSEITEGEIGENKLANSKSVAPAESLKSLKTIFQNECDILYKTNGDEIKVKVLEVEETKIKYKKCDNLEGPTYSMNISEVFMIKYVNGTKDVFNKENETKAVEVKTEPIKSVETNQTVQSGGMEALAIVGIVFLIVGLLLLLFVSILIGLLLLVLGLIFLIVGLSKG